MFIAMNRFRVKEASADAFEKVWRDRESCLGQMPGFMRFHLLKSTLGDGVVEFVSHSTWLAEADFKNWRDSDDSRRTHGSSGTGSVKDMLLGPPEYRGYEMLMDQATAQRTDFRSAHMDVLVEKTFAQESPAQQELRTWGEALGLPPIRIGAFEGRILECLLQSVGARRGVEIGTLGGYSASWILRGLPADGHLWSLELDPKKAERAQAKFNELGEGHRITVVPGDAKDFFQKELKDLNNLDFVFIDADKASYPQYIDLVIPRLKKGGLILADNAFIWGGMNHLGIDPEKLPPSLQQIGGYHHYSRPQFEGMSLAWHKLASHPELKAVILPTGEGMGFAVKI
jgi:caffeoyl-CoA O-methyltransferase